MSGISFGTGVSVADAVSKSGDTLTGPLLEANGTTAAPSYAFSTEPATGFYRFGSGEVRFSSNNVDALRFTPQGGMAMYSTAALQWGSSGVSSADLYLYRDAANTLAQRNGANAQTFRAYNTYTDASNYEMGVFDWNITANTLTIGAKAAGTGTTRIVDIIGAGVYTQAFIFSSVSMNLRGGNGSADLGQAANGFKRLYVDYTNTGTVGAVTINKAAGRVNIAAAGTSVVVTNSLVTANSEIMISPGNPGNAVGVGFYVTPAAGSFTITATPAVTNQTAISFFVVNTD